MSGTLDKKVFMEFSGYVEVNPESNMRYTGDDATQPGIIKVKDWVNLPWEIRCKYIIEDALAFMRDGDDLEWIELRLVVE